MLHLHRVLAAAVGGTLLLGGVQAVATSLPPDTPTPAVTPGGGGGAERGGSGDGDEGRQAAGGRTGVQHGNSSSREHWRRPPSRPAVTEPTYPVWHGLHPVEPVFTLE